MTEEDAPGGPGQFEAAFEAVHCGGVCEQVWKQETADRSLEELLQALGQLLNLDLSKRLSGFASARIRMTLKTFSQASSL